MISPNALSGIMKWIGRDEWRDAFDEVLEVHLGWACESADVSPDRLGAIIGEQDAAILFGCAVEDFMTFEREDGRNVVDDYLKRRGWNESVPVRRYLQSLRRSVMSLYEISDVVRDKSFMARDLLRGGEPVRISEKRGTHYLKPWDRIAARIVQVGPNLEMAGGALSFTHALSREMLKRFARVKRELSAEIRQKTGAKGIKIARSEITSFVTGEALRKCACLFSVLWLDDRLKRVLDPRLPKLCNTDGDAIVFTTVRYPLRADADRAVIDAVLDTIPEFRRDDENSWHWSSSPSREPKDVSERAQRKVASFGDGTISKGDVEIDGHVLLLKTNSRQRAETGRALIERAAGHFLGTPLVATQTAEQMMKTARHDETETLPSGFSPEEERAIIQQGLDSHYRATLDEPMPMLGNQTPRDAARSKTGRTKLVEWLKFLENSSARVDAASPMASYDMGWMWDELGIAALRR